ncbi:MAG: hypothetical protein ACR2KB_00770 [Chitinophagaceae bacterium]
MSNIKKTQSKPAFKPEISFKAKDLASQEKCTILHCTNKSFNRIRIWPNTCLVQKDGSRKKMLHTFNITNYPQWLPVVEGHCFTLVFEGLDKDCHLFSLLEDIPEASGWYVSDISRNEQDLYHLELY